MKALEMNIKIIEHNKKPLPILCPFYRKHGGFARGKRIFVDMYKNTAANAAIIGNRAEEKIFSKDT